MDATVSNTTAILKKHPLAGCEIQTSGWDNATDMVDTLFIYPHRITKRDRPSRGLKLGKGNGDKEPSEYDEETER